MGFPFCWYAVKVDQLKGALPMTVVAPMMVMPVVTMPVVTMPAMVPVAMMPVMVMPTYLHRPHLIDFVLRHDRRLDTCDCRHDRRMARDRRYGRSLGACRQQDRAGDQSGTEIQEIPKFHDVMALSGGERRHAVSPPQDECSLNSSTKRSGGAVK
jgi:hypothetical protein